MKLFQTLQKILRSLAAFPMALLGYGLSMLFIGHWFLPWEVIGGALLTIACLVGSYLCGRKAKKLEEEKKKQEEQKANAKVGE